MDAYQFLNAVWPDEGYYCIAIPFVIPNTQKKIYQHKVFEFKSEASLVASRLSKNKDIFFCVHSLKEPRIWNDKKKNFKTNELGAFETRVQSNMHSSKCFFMDLDIGNEEHKYRTQTDAIIALKNFCNSYAIPKPLVINSGYGIHVYWLLDQAISSNEWKQHAKILRSLAKNSGLKFDPSRITDEASVLRVAGTFNYKDATSPRSVDVLSNAKSTNTRSFISILQAAISTVSPLDCVSSNESSLGFNLATEYDGPVPAIKSLLSNCAQIAYLATHQDTTSEPEWYAGINIVRFVQDGNKYVHKFSEKHPDYDYDETEEKIIQLENKDIRPTSCEKIQEVCGSDRCQDCHFYGKVKSPIVAASRQLPAPTIKLVGPTPVEIPTPKNFKRASNGHILKVGLNADGKESELPIYEGDLYPIRLLGNEYGEQNFRSLWKANLPKDGWKEFSIDNTIMYDTKEFTKTLVKNGVTPSKHNIPDVQEYMIAYIRSLQQVAKSDVQYSHFGWTHDKTGFVLGTKLIKTDSYEETHLVNNAASIASLVVPMGTLEKQVELLKFYNRPKYLKHQFAILCGLASPIFYATGHHGAIVHLAGESGASKSTAIYAAASLWGKPSLYAMNGTRKGATTNFRNERIQTLCNLPTCLDEITHMSSVEAHDMAMSVTQPTGRGRLNRDGKEREAFQGDKSAIMLTTANRSLHNLLAQENQAGTASSMRILEITCEKLSNAGKIEADEFLRALELNYGHIGEAYIAYVVKHREMVENRVQEVMSRLDRELQVEASERFWSGVMAAAIVAGSIAKKLGLLSYDINEIIVWCKNYIKSMRGQVTEEYITPVGVLTNFMELNDSNILVINKTGGNFDNIIKAPKTALLMRYEIHKKKMWILKSAFKDYCNKIGMGSTYAIDKLKSEGIILEEPVKKVLGAGCSGYEKGQSYCILIDMANARINDVVATEDVATNITRLKR